MSRIIQKEFRVSLPRRKCRLLGIREGDRVTVLLKPEEPLLRAQATLDWYFAKPRTLRGLLGRVWRR